MTVLGCCKVDSEIETVDLGITGVILSFPYVCGWKSRIWGEIEGLLLKKSPLKISMINFIRRGSI